MPWTYFEAGSSEICISCSGNPSKQNWLIDGASVGIYDVGIAPHKSGQIARSCVGTYSMVGYGNISMHMETKGANLAIIQYADQCNILK